MASKGKRGNVRNLSEVYSNAGQGHSRRINAKVPLLFASLHCKKEETRDPSSSSWWLNHLTILTSLPLIF